MLPGNHFILKVNPHDVNHSKILYDSPPAAAAAAKSLQSCPTLCNPIDGSPPGSPIPGILQTRTLEWVAISFSNASKWKVKVKSLSCVRLFTTPWTSAHQAPPSMGFSRQEYGRRVPLPSPDPPPRVMQIETKIIKWDLIKIKSFCTTKVVFFCPTCQLNNPQGTRRSQLALLIQPETYPGEDWKMEFTQMHFSRV